MSTSLSNRSFTIRRTVIKDSGMKNCPLVPNCNSLFCPFPANLVLVCFGNSAVERVKQSITEPLFQSDDLFCEVFIHIQCLLSRDRMCSPNWMLEQVNKMRVSKFGKGYSLLSRLDFFADIHFLSMPSQLVLSRCALLPMFQGYPEVLETKLNG